MNDTVPWFHLIMHWLPLDSSTVMAPVSVQNTLQTGEEDHGIGCEGVLTGLDVELAHHPPATIEDQVRVAKLNFGFVGAVHGSHPTFIA